LKFPREAERFVKRDAGAHVADAERDHGQSRDRRRRFLIHGTFLLRHCEEQRDEAIQSLLGGHGLLRLRSQ
jgi:hypothetical protein